MFVSRSTRLSMLAILAAMAAPAQSQDADELAKQLSNPVASLISVPLQLNWDTGYGPQDGDRWTLNVQPVIPISISEHWNLISRTILPLITQSDVTGPDSSQSGLGDIVQSLFFSPKETGPGGWIWGVGPAFLVPTGGSDLTADQWALGPTFVVLKQQSGWTYGMLANQLWGMGGSDRTDLSSMFLQPFLTRAFSGGRTVALNLESSYDWQGGHWTVPANLTYSKVTHFGGQLVSLAGGARVYLTTPDGGPDWGLRFVVTLLYPR